MTTVPARTVLAVHGTGTPEERPFTAAVRALFATRVALGEANDIPMEGTYAQDGDPLRFDLEQPDGWHWTLVVPVPDHVTDADVQRTAGRFGATVVRGTQPEVRAAQLLHCGPYADEAPSLATLYRFVTDSRLRPAAAHTEVYLTDPAAVAPRDNRTVLRVPVWTD